MNNFEDVVLFGNTSLSDIFKQIHRNNKDTDKQISALIDVLTPLASQNAGSAIQLMPTVKDLIDVNVKNNDQLIKMAGIAQRGVNSSSSNDTGDLINEAELAQLIAEQNVINTNGIRLLEKTNNLTEKIQA